MARPKEAHTVTKSAALSTEFGRSYAERLFGKEAVDAIPLLIRGRNKGHPKGYINWICTTGAGYHPSMGCGVGPGVTVRAWISEARSYNEGSAMMGMWVGRVQPLCGSARVLTESYRERETALLMAEKAEREANFKNFLASLPDDAAREKAIERRRKLLEG